MRSYFVVSAIIVAGHLRYPLFKRLCLGRWYCLYNAEDSFNCRAVHFLPSTSSLNGKGGDNLSPPFSKDWVAPFHGLYIAGRVFTFRQNLNDVHHITPKQIVKTLSSALSRDEIIRMQKELELK